MNDLYRKIVEDVFAEPELFYQKLKEVPERAMTINTLKADEKTILDLCDLEYAKTDTEGSYTFKDEKVGSSIAYTLGLIYPQEKSAAKTILDLSICEPKLIVDLCAAPGGKTIDIAIKTQDKALIIANEVDKTRSKALLSNIEKTGISNIIITQTTSSDLAKKICGIADIVIVDAPCSGMGMARKYPSFLDDLRAGDIKRCVNDQKMILDDAYKILKKDGLLIYSTCTYTKEENEDQIHDLIARHSDLKIIRKPQLLSFIDGSEGQFSCVLKKEKETDIIELKLIKESDDKIIKSFIDDQLDIKDYYLYKVGDDHYLSLMPLYDLSDHVLRYGIHIGKVKGKDVIPVHSFYRANILKGHYKKVIDLNDVQYHDFIVGLEIKVDALDGYNLVTYKGYQLGFGKAVKGTLKNKYPKGLRIHN